MTSEEKNKLYKILDKNCFKIKSPTRIVIDGEKLSRLESNFLIQMQLHSANVHEEAVKYIRMKKLKQLNNV